MRPLPSSVLCRTLACEKPVPRKSVILDTDIGTDIDDTWALAQALRSPEIDLKLVLTIGDPDYRTPVAAKFLEVTGNTHVPIGNGFKRGNLPDKAKNQRPWLIGHDLSTYPGKIHQDGISAMIEMIMTSPDPMTIVCIR